MSNKKLRNKPCPCGSGQKFKNCCLGLPAAEVAKKREVLDKQVQVMLDSLDRERKERYEQSTHELDAALDELSVPLSDLLFSLGTLSLIPANQAKEVRFAHIAQRALSRHAVELITNAPGKLEKLLGTFDDMYGPSYESYEVDNLDIVYISWVKYDGNYYRTFSGTLAESEIFFEESLRKVLALAPALPEPYCNMPEFLSWAFALINKFIEEAGLQVYENSTPAASGPEKERITIKQDDWDAVRFLLEEHFVFDKTSLSPGVAGILSVLSKKPGNYSSEFHAQFSDIFQYPVVDMDDRYFIPFPQLLLSAGFFSVYAAAMQGEHKKAAVSSFVAQSKEVLGQRLRKSFGPGNVIENLTIEDQEWTDFCVKFDGKIICVKLASSMGDADKIIDVDAVGEELLEGYDSLKDNPSEQVKANGKPYRFDLIVPKLEPIFIVVMDFVGLDLSLGSRWRSEIYLTEIIPFPHLDYLLRRSANPLYFLRFLRAMKRLTDKDVRLLGDHIDHYSMYEAGGLQLPDSPNTPNLLVSDPTGGARYINQAIQKYRETRILAEVNGVREVLRRHWDHFYGTFSADGVMYLYRFDSRPTVTIEARVPDSERDAKSSTYLVFDSLCYFLDQHIEALEPFLGTTAKILLSFALDEKAKKLEARAVYDSDKKTHSVAFTVPPDAYELFSDGTNKGERTVLRQLIRALGVKDPEMMVDKLKPLSIERNFQSKGYYLAHKSYEKEVRPIEITPGDRMWVDEVISDAVLQAGVKPGTYTKAKDVGRLASVIKKAAMEELRKRIVLYPKRELVERAYAQLEMVYVTNEKQHYELLISMDTNKDKDLIEEYSAKEQDFTQLSFANRHLLEFAVQEPEAGDELLTDESYMELLALAERVVDIDFWGDSTYLGLQPGELSISEAGFPSVQTTGGEAAKLNKIRMQSMLSSLESRLEKIQKETAETEESSGGIKHVVAQINEAHKDTFGFTLEDRGKVEGELLELFNESDESPIIMITRRMLSDRVILKSGLPEETVTKIIDNLTLSQAVLLGKDISPSERYWREERVLNKPVVAFPGNEHVLLFSRFVVEKSILLYYDRLLTGRLEYLQNHRDSSLYRVVMDMVNNSAHEFEAHVAERVEEHGARTVHSITSLAGVGIPQEIGEIDGIVWDEKHSRVIVLEDKNNVSSRSPVEIKTEVDNYFGKDGKIGYYDKLGRKLQWVRENMDAARRHFGISKETKVTAEGVLVTKSILAAAILMRPPYKTMRLDELLKYLSPDVEAKNRID